MLSDLSYFFIAIARKKLLSGCLQKSNNNSNNEEKLDAHITQGKRDFTQS